jgi:hypothetical protein
VRSSIFDGHPSASLAGAVPLLKEIPGEGELHPKGWIGVQLLGCSSNPGAFCLSYLPLRMIAGLSGSKAMN